MSKLNEAFALLKGLVECGKIQGNLVASVSYAGWYIYGVNAISASGDDQAVVLFWNLLGLAKV